VLAASALPTAITIAFELSGLVPVGNVLRAIAGVPFGAMLAVTLGAVASGARWPIR
jgi:hypothetical protein